MNKKSVFLAVVSVFVASPGWSFFFNSGVKQLAGTNNYSSTRFYAHFGGDNLHLRPTFSTYHSNTSGGTFNTYSARLGYDAMLFGAGLTAGVTPRIDGYSNRFVGIDGVISLSPTGLGPIKRIKGSDQGGGAARGKGLARVDVGAGISHTTHKDELNAARVSRANSLTIGQTDLSGSVGASFLGNLITLDLTKSFYDKDLGAVSARGGRAQVLTGLSNVIQGFPNTSASVKFELAMLPLINPFVSYTRTTFELSQPASNAYAVGGFAQLQILEVTASYQRYVQAGQPDNNYYGLGASLRF